MDEFSRNADAVTNPARGMMAITPADGTELSVVPKALFVGTGGNLRLRCVDDGSPVVLKNVASGQILPLRACQVYATGTSAADIVALL